jgi:hypothetical protein
MGWAFLDATVRTGALVLFKYRCVLFLSSLVGLLQGQSGAFLPINTATVPNNCIWAHAKLVVKAVGLWFL